MSSVLDMSSLRSQHPAQAWITVNNCWLQPIISGVLETGMCQCQCWSESFLGTWWFLCRLKVVAYHESWWHMGTHTPAAYCPAPFKSDPKVQQITENCNIVYCIFLVEVLEYSIFASSLLKFHYKQIKDFSHFIEHVLSNRAQRLGSLWQNFK